MFETKSRIILRNICHFIIYYLLYGASRGTQCMCSGGAAGGADNDDDLFVSATSYETILSEKRNRSWQVIVNKHCRYLCPITSQILCARLHPPPHHTRASAISIHSFAKPRGFIRGRPASRPPATCSAPSPPLSAPAPARAPRRWRPAIIKRL